MKDLEAYLSLALQAADLIQPLLRKHFGKPDLVKNKPDGSVVTEVDPEAERMVREWIKECFPDHGILGEELGLEKAESPFRWVIDPLDGTLDYISGIPTYGCIIALLHQGDPIVGVIDCPETGDRYHAIKGQGSFWNGHKLEMKDVSKEAISEEVISMSFRPAYEVIGYAEIYDQLFRGHRRMTTLPNCFAHGLVARGSLGAMANFNLNLWDIAATKLLIEEAGGKFLVQKRMAAENYPYYDSIFGKPAVVDYLAHHFKIRSESL